VVTLTLGYSVTKSKTKTTKLIADFLVILIKKLRLYVLSTLDSLAI